jgi:hypothetical protein
VTHPPGPEHNRPSGLRNPTAAVRGVGAGALCAEALAMLLAIQPIRTLGGGLSGAAVGVVVALAVVLLLLAGLLRRDWAWYAAAAVQVLLLPAGLLHWSLAVLGIVFGLVWAYVMYVRRRVLSR